MPNRTRIGAREPLDRLRRAGPATASELLFDEGPVGSGESNAAVAERRLRAHDRAASRSAAPLEPLIRELDAEPLSELFGRCATNSVRAVPLLQVAATFEDSRTAAAEELVGGLTRAELRRVARSAARTALVALACPAWALRMSSPPECLEQLLPGLEVGEQVLGLYQWERHQCPSGEWGYRARRAGRGTGRCVQGCGVTVVSVFILRRVR